MNNPFDYIPGGEGYDAPETIADRDNEYRFRYKV